jgi:Tol biopolymer transport system component
MRHRLLPADTAADYSTLGYLLTLRKGALLAVPFDADRGIVSGNEITLAPRVASIDERGAFSASANGLVAYRTGAAMSSAMQLAWTDRDGTTTSTLPALGFPALTADGRRIAVSHRTAGTPSNTDIWLIDTTLGEPRRFTFDDAFDISPVWAPDGSRVAFSSNRKGVLDLFEKSVSATQDERLLLETPNNKFPADWSADGHLLFVNEDAVTGDDLWTVSLEEPRKPVRVLGGNSAESQGQFSPDGRWLAYRSNESGRWEIYLRPYPGPGSQQPVSRGGGMQPRWRRDGKELFYIGPDSRMMAVPINLPSSGERLEVGAPIPLFTVRLALPANQQFGYAVDPAGQRFLVFIGADKTSTTPITVLQNWAARRTK